jgi:UDP-N-acetylglucosamine--N-acetylmuramyl-(pentapeptide) pyrophosphoryl-undecaprenol N-acetylglucosamine transferase
VIFVTLGTNHDPFTRLVDGLAALPGDELVVQHGHSPAPPGVAEAVDFLPFADLLDRIRAADVVITHAGVGSILLCLRNGRTPLVVPRRRVHGEHVDDHQVELTSALDEAGKVVPVWDVAELPRLVAAAPPPIEPQPPAEGALHRAVRAALVA